MLARIDQLVKKKVKTPHAFYLLFQFYFHKRQRTTKYERVANELFIGVRKSLYNPKLHYLDSRYAMIQAMEILDENALIDADIGKLLWDLDEDLITQLSCAHTPVPTQYLPYYISYLIDRFRHDTDRENFLIAIIQSTEEILQILDINKPLSVTELNAMVYALVKVSELGIYPLVIRKKLKNIFKKVKYDLAIANLQSFDAHFIEKMYIFKSLGLFLGLKIKSGFEERFFEYYSSKPHILETLAVTERCILLNMLLKYRAIENVNYERILNIEINKCLNNSIGKDEHLNYLIGLTINKYLFEQCSFWKKILLL